MRKFTGITSIILAALMLLQLIFVLCYNAFFGIVDFIVAGTFPGLVNAFNFEGAVVQFIAGPILAVLAIFSAIACLTKKSRSSYIICMVSLVLLIFKFVIDWFFASFGFIGYCIDDLYINVYNNPALDLLFGVLVYMLEAIKYGAMLDVCTVMLVSCIALLLNKRGFVKVMRIISLASVGFSLVGFAAAISVFVFKLIFKFIKLINMIDLMIEYPEIGVQISISMDFIIPMFSFFVDLVTAFIIFAIISLPALVVFIKYGEMNKRIVEFIPKIGLLSGEAQHSDAEPAEAAYVEDEYLRPPVVHSADDLLSDDEDLNEFDEIEPMDFDAELEDRAESV